MKRPAVAALLALITLAGCGDIEQAGTEEAPAATATSVPAQRFTIADAERAGFVKGQQQMMYQMIGASDGWTGTLAGDTVELYSYSDTIPVEFFESSTQDRSISGWSDYCQVGNLIMLHREPATCDALRKLQAE